METLQLRQIAEAVGAPCTADAEIRRVVTDTSQAAPGSLFIAIRGERFDGHDFIPKAVESGASAVLIEHDVPDPGVPVLRVPSTREAFLDLAAWYRRLFHTFVAGVTGSVGKTSTKDMICAVLSQKGKTLKTQGNLNNGIGLPKTILGLDGSFQNAVIEMGMSHRGEISRLTRVAQPSVGVITNIGVSHIENLGSQENILQAKLEILEGMNANAPLILNGDDPLLADVCNRIERDILYYGIDAPSADVRATEISELEGRTEFNVRYYGRTVSAMIPVIGKHNVYNALAAFSVGLTAGMAPEDIVAGLRSYQPSAMRQNILRKDGLTVILDCYNASPDSMRASLTVLGGMKAARRIAVLGDMLELGPNSPEMHRQVGEFAAEEGLDAVFGYGPHAAELLSGAAEKGCPRTRHFDSKPELAAFLKDFLREGDAVLYKASRGMALEEVAAAVHGIQAGH